MKITSKNIEMILKANLVILSPPAKLELPPSFPILSITICKKEKLPPVKSINILKILQPDVLFLKKFQYAWGMYLIKEMNIFVYPSQCAVLKLSFGIKVLITYDNKKYMIMNVQNMVVKAMQVLLILLFPLS